MVNTDSGLEVSIKSEDPGLSLESLNTPKITSNNSNTSEHLTDTNNLHSNFHKHLANTSSNNSDDLLGSTDFNFNNYPEYGAKYQTNINYNQTDNYKKLKPGRSKSVDELDTSSQLLKNNSSHQYQHQKSNYQRHSDKEKLHKCSSYNHDVNIRHLPPLPVSSARNTLKNRSTIKSLYQNPETTVHRASIHNLHYNANHSCDNSSVKSVKENLNQVSLKKEAEIKLPSNKLIGHSSSELIEKLAVEKCTSNSSNLLESSRNNIPPLSPRGVSGLPPSPMFGRKEHLCTTVSSIAPRKVPLVKDKVSQAVSLGDILETSGKFDKVSVRVNKIEVL